MRRNDYIKRHKPMPQRKVEIVRTPFYTQAARPGTVREFEKRLDKTVSQIVRTNEPYCVLCKESDPQKLTCGHLFKRRHRATRWDVHLEGNLHTLCKSCNRRDNWKHFLYVTWYRHRFGDEAFEELRERAHSRRKLYAHELASMLAARECLLVELRGKAA